MRVFFHNLTVSHTESSRQACYQVEPCRIHSDASCHEKVAFSSHSEVICTTELDSKAFPVSRPCTARF